VGKNLKLPGFRSDDVFEQDESVPEIPFYPKSLPTWFPKGVGPATPLLVQDYGCQRCHLSKTVSTVCLESRGLPGGVLLVLASPSDRDDKAGELMEAGETALVMAEARKHSDGCRVTWAVRCAAGRDPAPESVDACRPYLAAEIEQSSRVVLFGPVAAQAATGVAFNSARLRRARAEIRGVPCFLVAHPHQGASRNKHLRKNLAADIEWAIMSPVEARPDGVVRVFLHPDEAKDWLLFLDRKRPLVVDAEHWPKSPWSTESFRLLCLGLCQDPARPVVIPEELLKNPGVAFMLKKVMEDPTIPKVNQDIKHDSHVLWRALGIDLQGVEWDTLMAAKLLDSDAPAGLMKTSWLVQYGGYKELGHVGSEDEDED